jgi:hypothetical protein
MRASTLGLVVLTGFCSQLVVRAGPFGFSVSPSVLTANNNYSVTWQESGETYVGGVYLVQLEILSPATTRTVQTIISECLIFN